MFSARTSGLREGRISNIKARTVEHTQRTRSFLLRVSDLLCMSNLAHASPTKEHDDNDDFQGTTGRAAQRR
jgi:hypothetical protein